MVSLPTFILTTAAALRVLSSTSYVFYMACRRPEPLLGRVQKHEGGRVSDRVQEYQRCLDMAFQGARKRMIALATQRKDRHY